MRIHGIFCWYDESSSWIGTAIASLGRFCDHIVALDGAYALYPGGKARSHPHQAEVILHTAEAAGVACTLVQPSEVWWGNEVEKRNKAFSIVSAFATHDDWLCIYDADYHALQCQPDSIRYELENTDCLVAEYGITDTEDWLSNGAQSLAVETKIQTQWVSKTRDLYRWNPTLTVGPAHGDYSIAGEDGERLWLRGPYELAPAHDISGFLTVHHRTKHRAMVRRESQQGYYTMRDALGVELPVEV